jgi:hypothetical protein
MRKKRKQERPGNSVPSSGLLPLRLFLLVFFPFFFISTFFLSPLSQSPPHSLLRGGQRLNLPPSYPPGTTPSDKAHVVQLLFLFILLLRRVAGPLAVAALAGVDGLGQSAGDEGVLVLKGEGARWGQLQEVGAAVCGSVCVCMCVKKGGGLPFGFVRGKGEGRKKFRSESVDSSGEQPTWE